jgi:hypothetical protein
MMTNLTKTSLTQNETPQTRITTAQQNDSILIQNDDIIDVKSWLNARGLLNDITDLQEYSKNIRWVKHTLKVELENPKRGIYRASQSALENSYERHLKARAEGKKQQALNAKKLSILKKLFKEENEKRVDQEQPPLGTEDRADFFKSEYCQQRLNDALKKEGLL